MQIALSRGIVSKLMFSQAASMTIGRICRNPRLSGHFSSSVMQAANSISTG